MDRPLLAVRTQLDDHLTALARRRLRALTHAPPPPPGAGDDEAAELEALARPETFAAATEALARARERGDALAVRRVQLVRARVATAVEEALGGPAAAEVARLRREGRVPVDDVTLSLGEALAQLPREPSRGRRGLLERAAGAFLWDARGPYGDARDAALRAAEALRAPSYAALRQDVTGVDAGAVLADAEALARATDDAYGDVLGYALRKLEPTLRPLPSGGARRHDLAHALEAPVLDALLPREDVRRGVDRWLAELGLEPTAGRRVRWDEDAEVRGGPRLLPVRVPQELHLLGRPRGGLGGLAELLALQGEAQATARVDEALPAEVRRLGDPAVAGAWAALAAGLAADEAWLRRYLRLPSAAARDAARLGALRALAELRRAGAGLGHALSLHRLGASAERAEEYVDRHRAALHVEPHPGFFLHDVQPQLGAEGAVRAAALAEAVRAFLEARFDQDWWRNPGAGAWLAQRFARGGLDAAADIAAAAARDAGTTEGAPPLSAVGARLVSVLGA